MLRREYLSCVELHKRLQDKIEGKVYTSIENDTLIVFFNSGRTIKYKIELEGISYEIIDGELNYDKIVKIILDKYEKFILSKFFRR